MVSMLASEPSPAFGSQHYWIFLEGLNVNHRRCLEESGQWLENIDWTHLVLASGKVVLQKRNDSVTAESLKLTTVSHFHGKSMKYFCIPGSVAHVFLSVCRANIDQARGRFGRVQLGRGESGRADHDPCSGRRQEAQDAVQDSLQQANMNANL